MKRSFYFVILLLMLSVSGLYAQGSATRKELEKDFDNVLSQIYKQGGPGCAALITEKGKPLYRKAFGMANIELGVPMKPEMVFRIGSITKQFTAIAILQLMEQGKLSLQDEITKFIPDYPVNGKKITIEHLLTHTSGIKSYTSMPSFETIIRKDMKPDELVGFFKNEPMDFDPGAKFLYNNSGYFLLGVIIEKVSGMSYPQYLEKNIFKPLGMVNSYYGTDTRIIPNRAAGYQNGEAGIVNADQMSMTLPYAAGSIQSTVDDLFLWHKAVHGYKLVKKETLQKAFSPYKLADGNISNYGYGWAFGQVQDAALIEHGGGINGFTTSSMYLPKEDIFVVLFTNTTHVGPDMAATKLAAIAMGKPFKEYKEVKLAAASLKEYEGVYDNDKGESRVITAEGEKLYSQRAGGNKFQLKAAGNDEFFFDNSLSTLTFQRKANKPESILFKSKDEKSEWKRTTKPIPVKKEIAISATELEQYIGEYALSPSFSITVTSEGDRLFAQATNQPRFEVFAESPDTFFLKVVEAKIQFLKSGDGKVNALLLHQGGQKMEGKKIK
ncbi:serine hydrolase [Flavihumibacter sp.]|uniref:serine hydrolase n=1 Tax=Flavihumibacter sp. TaxID=1913981 RepID=UPI002FC9C36B